MCRASWCVRGRGDRTFHEQAQGKQGCETDRTEHDVVGVLSVPWISIFICAGAKPNGSVYYTPLADQDA